MGVAVRFRNNFSAWYPNSSSLSAMASTAPCRRLLCFVIDGNSNELGFQIIDVLSGCTRGD